MSAFKRRFSYVWLVCRECGEQFNHFTSQPYKAIALKKRCEYCQRKKNNAKQAKRYVKGIGRKK